MKKINAGIIGTGFIGIGHIEALRRLDNVSVDAIADISPGIDAMAAKLGLKKHYKDYRKLISDPDIDCVHICTPNNLHFSMARESLMAGKHVLCEKPLTTSKAEAEELISIANSKGLVHAINFNVRFYPLMHHLKYIINSGELGNIFSIHGSYLQDWLFYPNDYNWRLEPELSGDSRAVADIGSHWMDLVEFVTGLTITEVMADFATFHTVRQKPLKPVETYAGKLLKSEDYENIPISTEDYASILFRFSNSGHGALTVSQVFAGKKNRITLEISGSLKSASWVSENPNELWIGNRSSANESLLKDPSLMSPESREIVSFPGGHNEGFPDTLKQLFSKVYARIADRTQSEDYPTFNAGLHEINLCEKILESNSKKIWIKTLNH